MSDTTVSVVGLDEVTLRLDRASAEAISRVRAKVQGLGLELLALVKAKYLTGAALSVQTGRLRRSINEETVVDGSKITSTVGTPVGYGRAWELGFSRMVGTGARGSNSPQARIALHLKAYAPRRFLQPALAEMRPRVVERLSGGLV